MATYTIKIVVAGEDRASGPLRQSKQAVDDVGESSEKSGPKINGFAEIATGALRRMGEMATDAAFQAAGAIAGFVSDAVTQAGNFEAGMNRFGAVVGSALDESGKSLEEFEQLFLDMGASTQYSAAQAQEAAINLAKGGIDPATLAAGGLAAGLNLAAAAELDLAKAAEITAKQYGVWVDQSADAAEKSRFLARSADLMAQAANASTVNVEDLAIGLAQAGGVAKLAGLSFEETVTSIGLISPGFSSASDAGTSFKVMLSRLVPVTDSQAEAMAELGLLTEQGTSKFYDATGSFIGMEAAAQLLHEATAGLSEEQRQMALNVIFGQDAIRAAALLAEQGAEGYRRFAESMDAQGSAAAQAAARQQGFNFALETAKGSLETFGIVAGTLALPALTTLLEQGIIPLINGATAIASALSDPTTALGAIAHTAGSLVVPAITGLAAATAAYALTQLPAMIAAVGASVVALKAQAAAAWATAAPFAWIGLAVAGVAWAINDFSQKTRTATQELLDSREWWQASTTALREYEAQQLSSNRAVAGAATAVEELRRQIETDVEVLGQRMAAGLVSEAQYTREMAAINAKKDSLVAATEGLNREIAAVNAAAAAGLTATNATGQLAGGLVELGSSAALTADEIEKLGKALTANFEKGAQAVAQYVSTEAQFLDGLEQRRAEHTAAIAALETEKAAATTAAQRQAIDEQIAAANAAYAEQERQQAESYASQQAAQRAHLGQMLIDYTVSQAQLGNIAKDQAALITTAIAEEYGIQESNSAATYLRMAQHIDSFASSSSSNVQELIGNLRGTEEAAVATEQAMTNLTGQYTAELVANFVDKKLEANEYAAALRGIPSRVATEVHTSYTSSGTPGVAGGGRGGNTRVGGMIDDNVPGRALGGPVAGGNLYEVAEGNRPELLVAGGRTYLLMGAQGGEVIPASPSAPTMGAAATSGGSVVNLTVAPVFQGAIVDNEQRLQQLAETIVQQARDLVTGDVVDAVDAYILGGGVR